LRLQLYYNVCPYKQTIYQVKEKNKSFSPFLGRKYSTLNKKKLREGDKEEKKNEKKRKEYGRKKCD